ncbi:hypothetical protein [Haloferula helveola]|uniref:hypothetical protein n=1 Tax=Haloferula helveola TaxID=490095 RepID=UPI0030D4EC35
MALAMPSCDNHKSGAGEALSGSVEAHDGIQHDLKIPESGAQKDIIISNWYLDQYRAFDTLNKIEGVNLESGTKISESPDSLLNKQLTCLKTLAPDAFESSPVMSWFEDQELVVKGLYSQLGVELEMKDAGSTTLKWAGDIVELQKRALEELR